MQSDLGIAYTVFALYFGLVFLALPVSSYPLMLGGAVILILGTVGAARTWPTGETPAMSLLVVSIVAGAVLAVPSFPAMGGSSRAAVPIGFLGSQAVVLFWLALRWEPKARSVERSSLTEALKFGVGVGVVLSLVATIPIGISLLLGASEAKGLMWVYPAYMAGTATAALCYWLLQGVSHRPVGLYLIGMLGGTCLYAAVSPVVSITRDEPFVLREMLMIALVCGVLVGPPVAIGIAEEPRADGGGSRSDANVS